MDGSGIGGHCSFVIADGQNVKTIDTPLLARVYVRLKLFCLSICLSVTLVIHT